MKSNATGNTKQRKNRIYKELVKIYSSAVKQASSIFKKNPDVHFFEEKDGWDNTPEPFTGHQKTPMEVEELFIWMCENSISPRSIQSPYIYTDAEIKNFKENHALAKVEDWKKSIEFYKKEIKKYENRIKDALSIAMKHENP